MRLMSDKARLIYMLIFIIFLLAFGAFWLDHIGLVELSGFFNKFRSEPALVANATDDEPSLIEREEFEKEKKKLTERIEDLDKREALITEKEKGIDSEKEKLEEMRKGLALETKKFEMDKKKYSGYKKNVKQLATKVTSIPPKEAVGIIVNWEDPLIIDVLRQIDDDARREGRTSVTSYLISLMPKEKASHIMYLMTQL